MVIVINALSARNGGGQTYVINLLNNIPNIINFKIYIFAPNDLILPDHPNVMRCPLNINTNNIIIRTAWEYFYLPSYLRKYNANILFCPGGVVVTKVPAGCKTVTMFRNMIPFDDKVRKNISSKLGKLRVFLLHRVMLKSMASADLTIFISNYARSIIENLIKVKNATTIYHGINSAFRNASIVKSELVPEDPYFLYVSRFDVYKHHDNVIKGYSLLSQNIRSQYKLVIVGELSSDEYYKCLELVEKLEVKDNVVFMGAIEYSALPDLYHYAYLNIFASSCENCPNIMLEALASGRPLVCSDVMPMPEFGGDNVLYFSPYDEISFYNALNSIIGNSGVMNEFSERAKKCSMDYDWGKSAASTWNKILDL